MSRAVVAIIAIVFVIGVGIWGLQAAVNNAGVDKQIDGESFTPDPGNVTELDHSNLNNTHYDESVDVSDANGNLMDPGEDYVWFESNGTILTVQGGDLDGQTSATIDYEYQTTTEDQRALAAIVGHIPQVLAVLIPVLGVALLFILLKG